MSEQIDQLAEIVWDYHQLHHTLKRSDCILVLCSNDIRVAEHAAQLFHQNLATYLIFSGAVGELTKGLFDASEAEAFADIAQQNGVPKSSIFIEVNSTNTGENIIFTEKLLREKQLSPESFIVVQKPFMERRAYATIKHHWPNKKILLSSPAITFSNYPNDIISKEQLIHTMVGDLQRIKIYPKKGFQISQEIPSHVWDAFEQLVNLGYHRHLISM